MVALRNCLAGFLALALLLGCAGKKSAPNTAAGTSDGGRSMNQLVSVKMEERGKTTAVVLEGTAPMSPNIFKLTDPDRIIVDLTDTKLGQLPASQDMNKGGITQITANQFDDAKSSLSRVVVGLTQPMEYQVESQGSKLVLLVNSAGGEIMSSSAPAGLPEIPGLGSTPGPSPDAASPETSPLASEAVALPSPTAVPPIEWVPGAEIPAAEISAATSPAVAPAPSQATELVDIQYSSSTTGTTVRLIGNGPVENYQDFVLKNPHRVVVDLKGMKNAYPGGKSINLGTPEVSALRIGGKKAKGADIRIVLDASSSGPPAYTITRDGNALVLNIATVATGETPSATAEVPAAEIPVADVPVPEAAAPTDAALPAIAAPPVTPGKPVRITGLGFKQMKDVNKSRLIIGLSNSGAEYTTQDIAPGKFAVTIANAKFEKQALRREFDTREFQTAIVSVSPKADKRAKTAAFIVEIEQQMPYTVTQEGSNLYVDVDIPPQILRKRTPTVSKAAPPPQLPAEGLTESQFETGTGREVGAPSERVMSAEGVTPAKGTEDGGPRAVPAREYRYVREAFMSESMSKGEPLTDMGAILSGEYEGRKFVGRKISLDFKDAEVRSIFRLIAEISKFNMIISDDVDGRVTIRLDDVPWDQAFAIILQTRGLWFERYGNIVRIAPADRLRRERESAAATMRAAKAAKPLDVLFKPVSFAQAATLTKQVASVLSERGTVDIDSRTNTLIIKDIRENLDKARKMVDILDTQTPQVSIESRIVEATQTFTRSFGITWSGNTRFTAATGNPTGIFFPNSIAISPFTMNFPNNGVINTTAGIKLGSINNIVDLDLGLTLGEQEGTAKLVSAPKVTVLDNKSATITAGSMIPFQTQTANAGSNVRFESAATTLSVTPHITNDGSILMTISATRSEPNFAQLVQGNPLIDTRSANTEVLVKSGNTTVLGGIYSTGTANSQDRLPFVSKIPILGALFRNYQKSLRRTELLIFVTPRIVGDEREAIRDIRD
ncbi:MAG: type IV pilus secretin PilQ [Pseudomonadota bacterium]